MPIQLTCNQCSRPFSAKPKDAGRKYCSFACYRAYEALNGRPNPDIVPTVFSCKTCGTAFQRMPGELREYRRKFGKDPLYCSRACSHVGRTHKTEKTCPICNTVFSTAGHSLNRTETCSGPCRRELQRRKLVARNEEIRPSAERHVTRRLMRGYVILRFPNTNGQRNKRDVYEHRYVMEQHLGRKLTKEETVHHKVKPTTNNDLSNLELFSSRHGPGQRVTEQIEWAIKILQDYPEFAAKAGFALHTIPREPVEGLFPETAVRENEHQAAFPPNVSATY